MTDPILVISIAVNVILAGATITQVLIYRNEIRNRVRPWVGRDSGDSGKLALSKLEDVEKIIRVRLFNHGSLPARSVSIKWYVLNSMPDKDVFGGKNSRALPGDPDDMLPNEGFTYEFDLTNEEYNMSIKKTLYFGFRVTYVIGNYWRSKNGKYELRGHWNMGSEFVDHVAVD